MKKAKLNYTNFIALVEERHVKERVQDENS